jgi:hypothetical protein
MSLSRLVFVAHLIQSEDDKQRERFAKRISNQTYSILLGQMMNDEQQESVSRSNYFPFSSTDHRTNDSFTFAKSSSYSFQSAASASQSSCHDTHGAASAGGGNPGNGDGNSDDDHQREKTDEESDEMILSKLTDKLSSYYQQFQVYSSQGNHRYALLCGERLLASLRLSQNRNKYLKVLSSQFFYELMVHAVCLKREEKLEEYSEKMRELNIQSTKEIFYLKISVQLNQKNISSALELFIQEILPHSTNHPKDESEAKKLLLPFFEEYLRRKDSDGALALYRLLYEQEMKMNMKAPASYLLCDDVFSLVLNTLTQGDQISLDVIQECIAFTQLQQQRRQDQLKDQLKDQFKEQLRSKLKKKEPSSQSLAPSHSYSSPPLMNDNLSQSLEQLVSHSLLSQRRSLYESHALGLQFCELFFSKGLTSIHLPVILYLSWLIDNLPLRLQSFVDLLFKYELKDVTLFEVTLLLCLSLYLSLSVSVSLCICLSLLLLSHSVSENL